MASTARYVPAARPVGSAASCAVTGMAPDCGVMLSQLPPSMLLILIEYCMPTTDGDSANGEASDCAPPLFALTVMVAGLTSTEGALRGGRMRRMRLLDEAATTRLPEASNARALGPV